MTLSIVCSWRACLGYVVFSNPAGVRVIGRGLRLNGGKLSAELSDDDKILGDAIKYACRLQKSGDEDDGRPILISRSESGRPLTVYILPLRSVRDIASEKFLARACAIVLTIDTAADDPADPALVRDLLGLTLAEARLAALVGAGISISKAAERLAITEGTARTALKRVFSKVGVSRQSELTSLLSKIVLRYKS